jgi:hypothetical protein
MGTIIWPPFLNRSENQYAVFDAAQCLARQCGDLETFRAGAAPPAKRPPARKTRPGRVDLSGRYAIVGRTGADFMGFAAPAFLVGQATNG